MSGFLSFLTNPKQDPVGGFLSFLGGGAGKAIGNVAQGASQAVTGAEHILGNLPHNIQTANQAVGKIISPAQTNFAPHSSELNALLTKAGAQHSAASLDGQLRDSHYKPLDINKLNLSDGEKQRLQTLLGEQNSASHEMYSNMFGGAEGAGGKVGAKIVKNVAGEVAPTVEKAAGGFVDTLAGAGGHVPPSTIQAPAAAAGGHDQILQGAISKITGALGQSKGAIGDIEAQRTAERARRFAQASSQITGQGGEAQFHRALSKLPGELTDSRPVLDAGKLSPEETSSLFNHIGNSNLSFTDHLSSYAGLKRVLAGQAPQRSQLANLEHIFGSDFAKTVMDSTGAGKGGIKQLVTDVANIPRTIVSTWDASIPLRQGLVLSSQHPVLAMKAAGNMFKVAFSPENFGKWMDGMQQSPEFARAKDMALYLSDPRKVTEGLNNHEESFMSNIAHIVPGVKASERAAVGYLNKLRFDAFNQTADAFTKSGIGDEKNLKSLADYINNASGRGGLGKLEAAGPALNTVLFSPRLMASRINLGFNPMWYAKQTPAVRKEAAKGVASTLGVGFTILGLASAAGAKVESDPRSTDFGKVRVGNTTYDIWGGFQQYARAIAQISMNQTKVASGKGAGTIKKADPIQVATRLLRGKLAPVPGAAVDLKVGTDIVGNKATVESKAASLAVPLWIQDVYQALQSNPSQDKVQTGVAAAIPSFFGVGVNSYQPKSSAPASGGSFSGFGDAPAKPAKASKPSSNSSFTGF